MTGHELQALRRLFFFSVPEAAAMIGGVSERAWRLWESGERAVPDDVVERMAELLDLRRQALAVVDEKFPITGDRAAVIWYETLDDWLTLAGRHPAQWRPSQSLVAEVLTKFANRVSLVKFNAPAYAVWLGGRVDSEAMRAAWAATPA